MNKNNGKLYKIFFKRILHIYVNGIYPVFYSKNIAFPVIAKLQFKQNVKKTHLLFNSMEFV